MNLKSLFHFIKPLRLYLYNEVVARIPFNFIRIPLARCYMNIGKHSMLSAHVRLLNVSTDRSQIQIGEHCVINPDVQLDGRGGKIIIKDNADIARGTWIFTQEHDPHSDHHVVRSADVVIEEYVWIAARVTIMPGVTIGRGSVIASGAVVTRDIPPMSIAGGVPAKVIGERKSKLLYKNNFFPYFYT